MAANAHADAGGPEDAAGVAPPRASGPWFGRWGVLAGLIVVVGIAAIVGVNLLDARRHMSDRAVAMATSVGRTLGDTITGDITALARVLRTLPDRRAMPWLPLLDLAARNAVLFAAVPIIGDIGSILVFDADGRPVLDNLALVPRPFDPAGRAFFVRLRGGGADVHVGVPQYAEIDGRTAVTVGVPVVGIDGSFEGVAVAFLSLDYFRGLMARLDFGPGGAATLLRDDGTIVMRSPDGADEAGRPARDLALLLPPPGRDRMMTEGTSTVDGVRRLVVSQRLPGLPLVLAVSQATDEVLRDWQEKAGLVAAATALLCGAVVLLLWGLRRELARCIRYEAKLLALNRRLEGLVGTDTLTGLANRRRFDTEGRRIFAQDARAGTPISALMIDADWFKSYNDRFGHERGDDALRAIGSAIANAVRRPQDLAARYGGEEFVVLLPNTDAAGAGVVAAAIHRALASIALDHPDNPSGRMTVSIGIAAAVPQIGSDLADLVNLADQALYRAKAEGRNRTAVGS